MEITTEIYYMMIIGVTVWGVCGFLIGKYSERSKWNDLIKSGQFPNPDMRPLEVEVMAAAKGLAEELDNSVPDWKHRKCMEVWLIESMDNLKNKRLPGGYGL